MAFELGGATTLSLDTSPAISALSRLSDAADLCSATVRNSQQAMHTSFAETVRKSNAATEAIVVQRASLAEIAAASRDIQAEIRKESERIRELEQAVKSSTAADEQKKWQREIEKSNAKIKEAKFNLEELRQATEQGRVAVAATTEERRKEAAATRLVMAASKDAAAANKEGELATKKAEQATKAAAAAADKEARSAGVLVQLEKQLADLTEQRARATTKVQAQGYNKDITSVSQQIKELKAGSGEESGGGFFSSLLSKASAATAGLFAFDSIVNRVKKGLDDYGAIKGVQATLTAVTGSAAAGAQEFAYIKQESDALGLSLVPTAKAYTGLFAASKEANLSVATTRGIFEGVAGAAKVLNVSAEDTNGILLALQQIASKGVVSSEELRGQIGERLPGAFGLAAKAMGLTTAELGKQLQAGKILSADFLPKFAAQLKLTYGDATADAATQVGANMGRINTFLAESSARTGALFAPAIAGLAAFVSASKTTGQIAQEQASRYFSQSAALKELTSTVTPLLARYEELNSTTGRNTTQQKELDTIIQQLAKSVPGAVTEFDKYGKALGLNGEAIKKFLADQENAVRYQNRKSLKSNEADYRELIRQQQDLTKDLNNTVPAPDGSKLKRRLAAEGGAFGGAAARTLSQAESDKITSDLTAQLSRIQDDINGNLAERRKLQGKEPLVPIVPPGPKELDGLIEAQEKIIKALKARQKKALNENKGNGGDFLLGSGGLDEQLDKAEKRLAQLEGKTDKSAAARENKLKVALAAYERERNTYRQLAEKAAEASAEDARAASNKQLALDLDSIRIASNKLIAAKKLAGKGNSLDAEQQEQAGIQVEAAYKAQYDRLTAIARTQRDTLLALAKDSDAKELEQLENRFKDEADKYANQGTFLQAAKEKYERDKRALLNKQANANVDESEAGAMQDAIADTANLGYQDPAVAERKKQEAILEVQLEFAAKRLKIAEELDAVEGTEKTRTAVKRLQNDIDGFGKHLDSLKREDRKFDIFKFVFGKNDSPELRQAFEEVANVVATSLSNIFQAQQQAAERQAAEATTAISELTGRIALERSLHEAGSASNLAGLRSALDEERQIRKDAQAEQRRAAQAQVVLDSVTQASNLVTSISNIFAGTSKIDLVLPGAGTALGIGLSSVLVAAFLGSKIEAYNAASNIGKASFFKGGVGTTGYTGDGNPAEESQERGRKNYLYHRQEYILPHDVTQQYRFSLLEPLHKGHPHEIKWSTPEMQALLAHAPLPDLDLPNKMASDKAQFLRIQHEHTYAPLEATLDKIYSRLEAIEGSNREIADKDDVISLGDGRMLRTSKNGGTHLTNFGPPRIPVD
jgi:tape measure domain-containing protein